MTTSFRLLDLLIVVVYLAALTAVGVFFSRRQRSLDDFFLAHRSMTWLPVGLSLMAALDSAIDYLMQPSSTIRYGLLLVTGTSSWLLLYPWVANVTLPFYRRLNYYTAYEYLEARFDVRVRTLAAGIFIVWRLGWMATAIYVPCLAVEVASSGALPVSTMVVVLGIVVTVYTALGGVKAVIWNDVVQFCVRFSGLAAVVFIATRSVPGGLPQIWQIASSAGKTTFIAPFATAPGAGVLAQVRVFFEQPLSLVAIMASLLVGRMAAYVGDQIMVQRLQTTRSLGEARRAFVVNAAGDVVWMFALSFVGLALFAYFQNHTLPPDFATDRILPYFMLQTFPAGVVGLVIASLMAASLSSVDSAINSCTSVVVVDFYNRLVLVRQTTGVALTPAEQRRQVLVSRVATFVFGGLGTILAVNVSKIGSLLEIANKLINAFTGPLFGIYLLAMFSRRAASMATLVAGAVGSFTSYFVAYHTSIGFMWPSTFGMAATLLSGWALAVILPERPSAEALKLTWRAVMDEPALQRTL
ncbi:MAG TPA: sodium/solute symporter [Vicinamibacterales bacterium]|nr:sodium/solute symporter [Vicinamibacterales bacterium]